MSLEQAHQHRINGAYDQATQLYQEVLASDPLNSDAHWGLGLSLTFSGEFEQGLENLKKAVECCPTSLNARIHLAKTYIMLSMFEEGKAELMSLLALDPEHAEAKKQLDYLAQYGF